MMTTFKAFLKQNHNLFVVLVLLILGVPLPLFAMFLAGLGEQKQISFQEFKNKLLEPGLVERIVVKYESVAKVYVRSTPQSESIYDSVQGPVAGNSGQYKYYFTIGSIQSFEEMLEDAQEALGIDPRDHVPVTYENEMRWFLELMVFAPMLLLLAPPRFLSSKMQGGLGVGGGGGKGARGIFNIGKAQITKVDRNAKNKIGLNIVIYFVLV